MKHLKGIFRSNPYSYISKTSFFWAFLLVFFQFQFSYSQIHLQGDIAIISIDDSNNIKVEKGKSNVAKQEKFIEKIVAEKKQENKKVTKKYSAPNVSSKTAFTNPNSDDFILNVGKRDVVVVVNSQNSISKAITKNQLILTNLYFFKYQPLISKNVKLFEYLTYKESFWARPPPKHCVI